MFSLIGLIGWYFFGWKLTTFVVLIALDIIFDSTSTDVRKLREEVKRLRRGF